MTLSITEENYLKCIYKLSQTIDDEINTNAIAAELATSPASVTDMLKRLSEKKFISYVRYRGVRLTHTGEKYANNLIRKHRLWEVFLVEKLNFKWDEVHDIAEQLEHVNSDEMTERLDQFLGSPKFDPHGDPIPDKSGKYTSRKQILLSDLGKGKKGVILAVREHSTVFLQYLDAHKLNIGATIEVISMTPYDNSLTIKLGKDKNLTISHQVASNLLISSN
jgi:DtxR family Mn-dependent transcriptional regulator